MAAYYNEIDPLAAQWLRNLIDQGLIAPGDVDQRSIVEVKPDDIKGYEQCHFFAGIGGWSYALRLAGIPDDRLVWTGSCPCQPFSSAGAKRGSDDARHLWPAFFHLIFECRPSAIFGEQVAGGAGAAWWDHVAADLESADYAAAAANLGAHSVGAPHIRQRLYWVAHANGRDSGREHRLQSISCEPGFVLANCNGARHDNGLGRLQREGRTEIGAPGCGVVGDPDGTGLEGWLDDTCKSSPWGDIEWIECSDRRKRPIKPGIFPLAPRLSKGMVRGGDRGLAPDANESQEGRVMRLRGYGNAIVPQVAAAFITAACLD